MSELIATARLRVMADNLLLSGDPVGSANLVRIIIEIDNERNSQTEHLRLKEEECKQLNQDKAELVEALQKSQQVMNTFGFIHGNATYSAKEKDKRAQHLMNAHMDKIFIKNSELLEKHKCD
tara:strand:- start:362 stop:727 length:366 start_codon:yes stop_codon:yes gene_type:complete